MANHILCVWSMPTLTFTIKGETGRYVVIGQWEPADETSRAIDVAREKAIAERHEVLMSLRIGED